jgi:hypothetical protein
MQMSWVHPDQLRFRLKNKLKLINLDVDLSSWDNYIDIRKEDFILCQIN